MVQDLTDANNPQSTYTDLMKMVDLGFPSKAPFLMSHTEKTSGYGINGTVRDFKWVPLYLALPLGMCEQKGHKKSC